MTDADESPVLLRDFGLLITRREDWAERLNAFIDTRRATPFAWGVQDCCLFAADAVQAMTDVDPLGPLREDGKSAWASRERADSLLASVGGLPAAVNCALGQHPIKPALAGRGDVVLLEVGDTLALGVCLGEFAAAPGPLGLEWVSMAHWRLAWRIG